MTPEQARLEAELDQVEDRLARASSDDEYVQLTAQRLEIIRKLEESYPE